MEVSLQHFREQVKRLQSQCRDVQDEFGTVKSDYFRKRKQDSKLQREQQIITEMMGGSEPSRTDTSKPYTGHKVPPSTPLLDEDTHKTIQNYYYYKCTPNTKTILNNQHLSPFASFPFCSRLKTLVVYQPFSLLAHIFNINLNFQYPHSPIG